MNSYLVGKAYQINCLTWNSVFPFVVILLAFICPLWLLLVDSKYLFISDTFFIISGRLCSIFSARFWRIDNVIEENQISLYPRKILFLAIFRHFQSILAVFNDSNTTYVSPSCQFRPNTITQVMKPHWSPMNTRQKFINFHEQYNEHQT